MYNQVIEDTQQKTSVANKNLLPTLHSSTKKSHVSQTAAIAKLWCEKQPYCYLFFYFGTLPNNKGLRMQFLQLRKRRQFMSTIKDMPVNLTKWKQVKYKLSAQY